ncbi:MAG: hypothetical protein ACR2JC_08510 [Chloroflexota bacterium]|nr:MAG: hypothetical protein DLM70_15210 [Chloroflexota bacterium]
MNWGDIEAWLAMQRRGFCNGLVFVTPVARTACLRATISPFTLLARHVRSEFGEVAEETVAANRAAIAQTELQSVHRGGEVVSAYRVQGETVIVVTDRHAATTTILLAPEYRNQLHLQCWAESADSCA